MTARHHIKGLDRGTVRRQILADITLSRKAYQDLVAAGSGSSRIARELKKAWDEYLDEMKSNVADVKNSGSRFGGAVTAAAFLKKFAGDLVWAHLDIAGTAWDVPRNELYEGGASGVGVRMLVRFVEGLQ